MFCSPLPNQSLCLKFVDLLIIIYFAKSCSYLLRMLWVKFDFRLILILITQNGLSISNFSQPQKTKARLKITDSRSPVMMTGQIFFSPDKPRFWPVKLMNIIITLLPMEHRITLAVRHCRSSFCRQVGEKFIHTLLSSFPRFSPVLCRFIYTFSIIVLRCRKSPRLILYLHIGET